MNRIKYIYNPVTCRYEPARISVWSLSGYLVLFGLTTSVLFFGLLFLHGKLFTSPKAIALRKENSALKHHYASLQNELTTIESTLYGIKQKDQDLYKKLFNTTASVEVAKNKQTQNQDRILLADAAGFRELVKLIKEKSSEILDASNKNNEKFKTITVSKNDLNFLLNIPSIPPVAFTEQTKLASGFGTRINPYHKGQYEHSGADFTAERGSSVLATADGKVIRVINNSILQAGYGNLIEIDHGNNIITRYAHLDNVQVRSGQKVSKGVTIGTLGMSGGSIAPHVHYEIIRNGEAVNPVPYMMEGLSGKQYSELLILGTKMNQSLD